MSYNLWSEEDIKAIEGCTSYKTLAEQLNRTRSAVASKAYELGIHIGRRKLFLNEDFFKSWSSEMAYVLGYWFADGNIILPYKGEGSYAISFTSKDKDVLEKVKRTMNAVHNLRYEQRDNTYTLRINSKVLVNDIIKLGGEPNKSLTAKFPKVPQKFVFDFIRGYWDGDGFIFIDSHKYKHGYPSTGCTGTYHILATIQHYLKSGKLYERKGVNGVYYNLVYAGKKAQEILSLLYNNASIYMNRKYNLYLKTMEWEPRRKPWAKEKEDTITNWSGTTASLARFLNRTYGSVDQKKRRLELI